MMALLRLSSPEAYSLAPQMWHTLLTLQVTWCSANMRTMPPQRKPSSAPDQLMVTRPPITAGMAKPTSTSTGKRLLMRMVVRSARRSGT